MGASIRRVQVHDKASLDSAATAYIAKGFIVANRGDDFVTLQRKKQFSPLWAVVGLVLCVLPLLIYLIVYAGQASRAVHAGMLASIPLCPFRWLTGPDCPLCGLSHAFGCLLTGNVAAALHFHSEAPELFAFWVVSTVVAAVHSLAADGPWAAHPPNLANPPPTPPPSH